ncbi:MAG: hypothetical protein HYZ21_00195 [Chloroflexi bacterium]|nr:hypothetical protein [Chloroflexota bacterium]
MSCDYQRNRIWCGIRSWYRHHVSETVRDKFEGTVEDFVKEWIKNALEEDGKRAIKAYEKVEKEREKKQKPVPTSVRKDKNAKKSGKRREPIKPLIIHEQVIADPFERVYRQTKEIIVPGHIQWKDDQREEMTEKMRRVMHWMHVRGETPDANPIHGKHGLPRISSVAAYAVVHDWLTAQGVKMKSPFDSIYEAVWRETALNAEQTHDLEHLLEELEIEMNKKQNANPEQEEEVLHRIQKISPTVYNKIVKKFPKFQTLTLA